MRHVGWFGALMAALGALGCGGGPLGTGGGAGAGVAIGTGANNCGEVAPCGGSLAGTWKFDSACIVDPSAVAKEFMSAATQICATATLATTSVTGSGTETFGAANTYQNAGVLEVGLELTVPLSCFGAGRTCADLQTAYTQQMQQSPKFKSAMCSIAGSACVCALDVAQDITDSGTYTTTPTTYTTTSTTGVVTTDPYCVQGDVVHDLSSGTSTTTGASEIVGDVVFTKQ